MAASEMAYGEGHPATFTQQPAPTTRRMELSGLRRAAGGTDRPTQRLPHARLRTRPVGREFRPVRLHTDAPHHRASVWSLSLAVT